MRTRILSAALVLLPATLLAQASGQARGSSSASGTATAASQGRQGAGSANANVDATGQVSFEPPRSFSASGKARLAAMYNEAREKDCPPEPMAKRVAEGQAKGASEAAILASTEKVKANLEASHDAQVKAGRHPTHDETASGANAMERGVTSVQLETIAQHTPSDRSLVVALDVLTKLAANGTPVTQALSEVQAKLDARAPDASITGLLGARVGGRKGGN